ncbi:hypothetical protein C3K47_03080 [Solitalea longa]|uniref:Uncharacterized protein n=1 Tax=Solitalea longa TaxID=2079460 RepID=A0A2S5A817_9SPHI|nr:hypothetical protein [Solitalea longa]POY38397.1 hypothetical protein C3K47_03080 [Solitalea longa]
MNNTFSFYRLKLLFQKDWAENKKLYLLALPGLLILITLVYRTQSNFKFDINWIKEIHNTSQWYINDLEYQNEKIFFGGWFLTSLVAIFIRWNKLLTRKSLIDFLLLPATSTEKFIFNWLWIFLIPFFIYVILFQIVDFLFISSYIEKIKEANIPQLVEKLKYFNISHFIQNGWYALGYLTIIFSALLLSPFIFKKYSILKGILIIPVFSYLLNLFSDKLLKYLYPFQHGVNGLYFSISIRLPQHIENEGFLQEYSLSENHKILIGLILFGTVPILIWLANWYKIKEKQI